MANKLIYETVEAYDDAKAELAKAGEALVNVAKSYGFNVVDSKDVRSAKAYLLGLQRGSR